MSHLQSPYGAAGVGAASSQHALVGPGTSAKHLSNSTPGGYAYDEPTPELPAEKAYEMSDAADPNWHDAATRGPNAPGSGKKLLWTLLGVTLAIVVIAAVVVGAVLGTRKPNEDDASSSGNSSKSVSSDPSNFEKDSRLHNSFYGICYTPNDAQYQYGCGAKLDDVMYDVQLLSQLTSRVRLYGSDCNVTALMLQSIQETKTNLTIYPAIYLNQEDPNDEAWTRQVDNITFALDAYGTEHVSGITVGNEYILDGGSTSTLLSYVDKMKDIVSQKGWNLTVGTADAGSVMTVKIAEGVDYLMANDHAWFAGTLVEDGPGWTWEYFEENDQSVADEASNKPDAMIAETGWPSTANDTADMTYINDGGQTTGAVASIANLQTFLDGWVCTANTNGTEYFWFEFMDEEWKDALYGGVEAHWGLFDTSKNLKNITIPDCSHS